MATPRARVAAASVAVLAALVPAASSTAAAPSWWSYDRPAEYGTVKDHVFVPMSDGTPIHCVLARPAVAGSTAPGTFPGLITSYTPYGALSVLGGLPGNDYWAARGYVAMSCDVRGTGYSGGVWQGLLSALENQDNYELLAWMRQQEWSNGRLGQLGVSYGGMTAMRVASLHPPGLLAISPVAAQDDLYREDIYPGGIKSTPGTGDFWPVFTTAVSGGRELAPVTYAQYLEHPLWDHFWKQISMWTKWNRVTTPILAIGGWNDTLVPGGAPANWIGLEANGHERNYLIMGPWGHAATGAPAPLPAGAQLAWFDYWLKDLPGAPLPTSVVTSYEQPAGRAGLGWQDFSGWPPPRTRSVERALRVDRTIASTAGVAGTTSYTTLPTDQGDSGLNDTGAIPPGERADQTVVFETGALAGDLVIAGRVVVNLKAVLSHTDGNFKAVIYDVAPDGSATFLNEGYLKASHRLSHEWTTAVVPGAVNDYAIEIFPMHWRFAKGHGLRLRIYGGHSTELTPEPVPVTTTVSLGAGGSTVILPVLVGAQPDLTVESPLVSAERIGGADSVTFSARVRNVGDADATGATVRFLVDGAPLGPDQTIAALAAGGSATVTSSQWSAKHQTGAHTVRVVVDPGDAIAESDEHNNAAETSFTVRGNKIRNGSFEQSSTGAAPDAWTPSGPTSYGSGGSDGMRSVTASPGGTWTSEAVTVTPGAVYELSVHASGGGGRATLQQLGPDGAAASSSVPLASALGFAESKLVLTALPTTTQLRVVLVGAATGTTTFDDVQLIER
jgi:uncharacterized protein